MTRADETLSTRDIASPPAHQEEKLRDGTERDVDEPQAPERAAHDERPTSERDTFDEPRAAERDTLDEPQAPARDEPVQAADTRRTDDDGPLLPESQGTELQSRWEAIQTRFVDDPRSAVEEADALVASTMQQLADNFASAREDLEGQWSRGDDVSTEDLRVALQRYRSFFRRLLSA